MSTAVIIIVIGLFIFWGHYLNGVFERKSIPDVLGLMFIGMIIGPVLHLVDPSSFGKFGSIFSNLVLIFILFESGLELKLAEVKASFKSSAGITVAGFVTTWISLTLMCYFIFDLSWLSSVFVGATLGGTSSAVVVGLVRKIAVQPKTSATLIMESAETDVFTLAIPISILGLMLTGEVQTNQVISQFVSSLVMALLIGISGSFLWSFILNQMPSLKTTHFSTPAFLFILYGIAEYLNFSGPLTALSFGIAIGNLQYIEPGFIKRFIPDANIVLSKMEKDFFGEIVFLLRTFFFVFIGISIQIGRLDWLIWGVFITLILYFIRLLVIKYLFSQKTPLLDKATMSIMIPKGLGAAVIATLPLQQGHPDGEIIQSICFSIILLSTLFCVLGFVLLKLKISLPFYRFVFRHKDDPSLQTDSADLNETKT